MESTHLVARAAIGQMPPEFRFKAEDGALIYKYRDVLMSLQPAFVDGFYSHVYSHPPTAAIFRDGERPEREATLANWWLRTVNGPLDDDYFAWMAMVGLVHVVRGVTNPMMLAMTDYIVLFVFEHLPALAAGTASVGNHSDSPLEAAQASAEVFELSSAFFRLSATVGAVIAHGYDEAVASAMFNIAGMQKALLERLRDQEVSAALQAARKELQG
ncbi:protoglobin domain-containing protein [Dactylosporangium sp. NPDC005572]|uniref:protoglobin domain-containing protein n=1 Tax=Dactylosporangium sp. NPDC005572 TaxID=3156889 RepID=UPI0033AC8B63